MWEFQAPLKANWAKQGLYRKKAHGESPIL